MGRKLPTLERRRRVVEKTKARFAGKAFRLGESDCVKLARFHLTQMGHKLPSTGHYKTAAQAGAALKKQGAKNIAGLLDKFLERIPPAAMLLGDVAMPPSDPEDSTAKLGTVIIKVAPTKFLGWHPSLDLLVVMDVSQIDVAWRA